MSTVIKAGQDFKLVKQLTTLDLADHLAEAHHVVAEARAEATAIRAQAQREAAAVLRTTQERGYAAGQALGRQAGLEAGRTQGLAEAQERFGREQTTLCAALGTLMGEFNARQRDLLIEARHHVLEFAVGLARRVAKRVGELDRSVAAANFEEALRLVLVKTDITARVNPLDAETLRRFAGELAARVQEHEHVRVVEDESVAPGGCLVTAGATEIDARLETQMDEVVRLLLG